MSDVEVMALGDDRFAVAVHEGEMTTHHKVAVHWEMLQDLGLGDAEPATVVYETFAFLLDREPAAAIKRDFPLEEVADHFPDYFEELRVRLS
jgi:hypothetical protein